MSHRANLVLVDQQGYKIFHSHAALVLDTYLFWGPEHAIAFFEQHAPPQHGWYDTIWAEGGALIDTTCKIVMLYGGEDIQLHMPRRRLYLQLMRQLWPGWTITWAMNGLFDLVDHVSYPREAIFDGERYKPVDTAFALDDFNGPDVLLSIRLIDGTIRFCGLSYHLDEILAHGETLVRELEILGESSELIIGKSDRFPFQGLHIDVQKLWLYYWSARPVEAFESRINPYWRNWTLKWLRTDYESHITLAENRIKLQSPTIEELLNDLEQLLVVEKPNPSDRDDPGFDLVHEFRRIYPPSTSLRKQLFEQVVKAWRTAQSGP